MLLYRMWVVLCVDGQLSPPNLTPGTILIILNATESTTFAADTSLTLLVSVKLVVFVRLLHINILVEVSTVFSLIER